MLLALDFVNNVLPSSGVIVLLTVLVGLLVRTWRQEGTMQKRLELQVEARDREITRLRAQSNTDIAELKEQNSRCEFRMNLMIVAMQRAGLEVPSEIWK